MAAHQGHPGAGPDCRARDVGRERVEAEGRAIWEDTERLQLESDRRNIRRTVRLGILRPTIAPTSDRSRQECGELYRRGVARREMWEWVFGELPAG